MKKFPVVQLLNNKEYSYIKYPNNNKSARLIKITSFIIKEEPVLLKLKKENQLDYFDIFIFTESYPRQILDLYLIENTQAKFEYYFNISAPLKYKYFAFRFE